MAEEESPSITLSDDEGNTTQFDILDTLDYQGEKYVVVVPSEVGDEGEQPEPEGETAGEPEEPADADEDEYVEYDDEETVEVVILHLVNEENDEYYETVDDDDTLNRLFEMFHDRHVGEYDFE